MLAAGRLADSGRRDEEADRCAESFTRLLPALAGPRATAAAEMRRHLQELEAAVTAPEPRPAALRDVFAGYRETPASLSSSDPSGRC